MVITAGPTTPLSGQRLIVDDIDSEIVYSGNWTTLKGRYTSNTSPTEGLPYGNSTHQATSAGQTATFQFSGEALGPVLFPI